MIITESLNGSLFTKINLNPRSISCGSYKLVIQNIYYSDNKRFYEIKKYHYFEIIPDGIILAALSSENNTNVSSIDPIYLMPAFYSYVLEGQLNFNNLSFKFYCKFYNPTNIETDLYQIKSNNYSTSNIIDIYDTCFKTKGKFNRFQYYLKLFILIYN